MRIYHRTFGDKTVIVFNYFVKEHLLFPNAKSNSALLF